jgi:carbonic anhydrase/acetyltransferase-like protein (isoleucine patch superfamily)
MILTLAGRTPRVGESVYIAPSADVIGDVELADNSSIWFQCVLRGDIEPIRVGLNSNIQDGTVIHTMMGAPTIVGNWVTVGHQATLHGCTIGDHCLIGMGAVLLNHVQVGEGSIVAAGALVAENTVIPPRSLYMGVPARFKRAVSDEDLEYINMHATNYLRYKKDYLALEA